MFLLDFNTFYIAPILLISSTLINKVSVVNAIYLVNFIILISFPKKILSFYFQWFFTAFVSFACMISLITTYSLGENDDILEILGLLGRQSDGLGLLFIHLLVNLLIFIDAAVHLFYLFKSKKTVISSSLNSNLLSSASPDLSFEEMEKEDRSCFNSENISLVVTIFCYLFFYCSLVLLIGLTPGFLIIPIFMTLVALIISWIADLVKLHRVITLFLAIYLASLLLANYAFGFLTRSTIVSNICLWFGLVNFGPDDFFTIQGVRLCAEITLFVTVSLICRRSQIIHTKKNENEESLSPLESQRNYQTYTSPNQEKKSAKKRIFNLEIWTFQKVRKMCVKLSIYSRGLAICCLSSLVWICSYVNVTSIPMLVWATVCMCAFSIPRRRFKWPAFPSYILVTYMFCVFALDYVIFTLVSIKNLVDISFFLNALHYDASTLFEVSFLFSLSNFVLKLVLLLFSSWVCKAFIIHNKDFHLIEVSERVQKETEGKDEEVVDDEGDDVDSKLIVMPDVDETGTTVSLPISHLVYNYFFLLKKWAYVPVLCLLCLAALSSLDLLHLVLLLFCVIFFYFPKSRYHLWGLFVTFVAVFTLILYVWQIYASDITGIKPPTRPALDILDVIGIKVQLIPLYEGKFVVLVIMLCFATAHAPFERDTRWTWSNITNPQLFAMKKDVLDFLSKYGIYPVYAFYLGVGLSPPLNVCKCISLIFLFILLATHLRSMKPTNGINKMVNLHRVLLVAVWWEGLYLIMLYTYQFDSIALFVNSHWPSSSPTFKPSAWGLIMFISPIDNLDGLHWSDLFVSFLPQLCILVGSIIQLRISKSVAMSKPHGYVSFDNETDDRAFFDVQEEEVLLSVSAVPSPKNLVTSPSYGKRLVTNFQALSHQLQRLILTFLYHYSGFLVLFLTALACIDNLDFMGDLNMIFLVIYIPSGAALVKNINGGKGSIRPWQFAWAFCFTISVLDMLIKIAYQLDFIEFPDATWFGLNLIDGSRDAYSPKTYGLIWDACKYQLIIILASIAQRYSYRFEADVLKWEREDIEVIEKLTREMASEERRKEEVAENWSVNTAAALTKVSEGVTTVGKVGLGFFRKISSLPVNALRRIIPSRNLNQPILEEVSEEEGGSGDKELKKSGLKDDGQETNEKDERDKDEVTFDDLFEKFDSLEVLSDILSTSIQTVAQTELHLSAAIRNFIRIYVSQMTCDIGLFFLLLSAVSHPSVFSIFYLFWIGILLVFIKKDAQQVLDISGSTDVVAIANSKKLLKKHHIVASLLLITVSLSLLFQYVSVVSLPPFVSSYICTTSIIKNNWVCTASESDKEWYGLEIEPSALFADIFALLFISMWTRNLATLKMQQQGSLEIPNPLSFDEEKASSLSRSPRSPENTRKRSPTAVIRDFVAFKPSDAWHSTSRKDLAFINHRTLWDAIQFHFSNSCIKIVLIAVFVSVSAQLNATLFNVGYLLIASAFLYFGDELVEKGSKIFFVLIFYNWIVFALQLTYQAPWFPDLPACVTPPTTCNVINSCGSSSPSTVSSCFSWLTLVGFQKFTLDPNNTTHVNPLSFSSGLGPSLMIFILSLIQLQVYHSPAYVYVREFYLKEAVQSKARAVESTRIIARQRLSYWIETQAAKMEAALRLFNLAALTKAWQSQLWERDDAANYPPKPPSVPPNVGTVTSTSVTIYWPQSLIEEYKKGVNAVPLVGYKLQYQINKRSSMFGNWESVCINNPTLNSYKFKNFIPLTPYVFRFAFITNAGIGDFSPISQEACTLSIEEEEEIIKIILKVKESEKKNENKNGEGSDQSVNSSDAQSHTSSSIHGDKIENPLIEGFKDTTSETIVSPTSITKSKKENNSIRKALEAKASKYTLSDFERIDADMKESDQNRDTKSSSCSSWLLTYLSEWLNRRIDSSLFPSLPSSFIGVVYAVVLSNSIHAVYLALIVAHMTYASLLSAVYAMSVFIYLIWCNPRPNPSSWRILFIYTIFVIFLKYAFQLTIFCIIQNPMDLSYFWSMHPWCANDEGSVNFIFSTKVQTVQLIGLTKLKSYLSGAVMDFFVLLALLLHRYALQLRGLWKVFAPHHIPSSTERKVIHEYFYKYCYFFKSFVHNVIPDNPNQELLFIQKAFNDIPYMNEFEEYISITDLQSAFNTLALYPSNENLYEMVSDIKHRRNGELDFCEFYWQVCILINEKKFIVLNDMASLLVKADVTVGRERKASIIMTPNGGLNFRKSLRADEDDDSNILQIVRERKGSTGASHKIIRKIKTYSPAEESVTFLENSDFFIEPLIDSKIIEMKRKLYPNSGNPEILKSGGDFYVWTFSIQMIIILDVLFTYNNIVGIGTDIYSEIFSNNFAGDTVIAIILCILLIIVDRVAYLKRNMYLKVALQYLVTIGVHYFLFIQAPLSTQRNFQDSVSSQVLYVLVVMYLLLGATQIYFGYPFSPPVSTLTHSGYGVLQYWAFVIYRVIPFVWEMSVILDWVCARTSMDLSMFMCVDDIAASLYVVKYTMVGRGRWKDIYSGLAPQPFVCKFFCGYFCLFFLLLVILGPLITFSSLNPAQGVNPVVSGSIDLLIRGGNKSFSFELFHTDQVTKLHTLTGSEFDYLVPKLKSANGNRLLLPSEFSGSVQQIIFLPYGNTNWDITPPSLQILQTMLNDNSSETYNTVYLDVELSFTRLGPPGSLQVTQVLSKLLSNSDRSQLGSWDSQSGGFTGALQIPNFVPRIIRLPATISPIILDDNLNEYANSSLTLNSSNIDHQVSAPAKSWWVFSSVCATFDSTSSVNGTCGLNMYIASDKIVNGITFLSTYSVLTLYIGVVYTIARLMRTLWQSYPWQISFSELPFPDDLSDLCDGISIARNGNYEGNLRDEIKLWEILISLFRNPAVLMRITRAKIKYE